VVLRGNSPAKVDAQGRLKIPTSHRKVLEDEYGRDLFVTSISGENVLLYPLAEWEKIEAKLQESPKMRPEKLKFMRNTSYYGQIAKIDKQGRVMIQSHLREAAQINGDVAVIGYLGYLEVWNHDRFLEQLKSDPYTKDDAIALGELGI
jgi:MraZ protein